MMIEKQIDKEEEIHLEDVEEEEEILDIKAIEMMEEEIAEDLEAGEAEEEDSVEIEVEVAEEANSQEIIILDLIEDN